MKKTKKALLTSVFALILSVAMLAGSTMAWFTDTASSTGNKIIAGNLDVDLLMAETATGTYESIANQAAAIFDGGANANNTNKALWEPGATHVAYLAVRNNGNLALKYNIVIDVTDFGLVGALEYAIVPFGKTVPTAAIASWADAQTKGGVPVAVAAGRFTAATGGCLDEIANDASKTNETDYFALVVHMKESAGNEYQGKSVTIDVNVVATQKDAEEDAFDNTYDENATYPTLAPYINKSDVKSVTTQGQEVVITGDVAESTVPASITSGGALIQIVSSANTDNSEAKNNFEMAANSSLTREIKTTEATENTVTYNISYIYTEDGKSYDVSEFAGIVKNVIILTAGLEEVKVTHSHAGSTPVQMDSAASENPTTPVDGTYFYNAETGKLTIWSKKYSEFEVSFKSDFVASIGSKGYSSLKDAFAEVKAGETIVMLKSVTVDNSFVIDKNITLNLNGKTIEVAANNWNGVSPTKNAVFWVKSGAKFTVDDASNTGKIISNHSTVYAAIALTINNNNDATQIAELVVNGGLLQGYYYGVVTNGNRHNTKITVNNGTLTGTLTSDNTSIYHPNKGTLVINGGKLIGYDGLAVKGGTNVEINGGEFIATGNKVDPAKAGESGCNSVGSALYIEGNYGYVAKVIVNGGTFKVTDANAPAVRVLFNEDPKATLEIKGGTFDSDPSAYLATNYVVAESAGKYVVEGLWPAFAADNYERIDTNGKTILIKTPAQLALLAKNINAGTNYNDYTITIDGTVDMGAHKWVPINAYGKLSGVTIKGINNATISNLSIDRAVYVGNYDYYAGFIAQATGNLTIKDLVFKSAVSVDNGSGISTVLGIAYGNVTMENVVVKDSVIQGETKAGAFIGFTGGSGNTVTLNKCTADNVEVKASYSYALMVGLVNTSDSVVITDCQAINNCKTTNTTKAGEYAGTVTYQGYDYGYESGSTILWLLDVKNAWAEKRSNPSPVVEIESVNYTLKGDEILTTNGSLTEGN